MTITWTGFHGTDYNYINSIKKAGYNKSTDDNWLGEGVYFFQNFKPVTDGFKEALFWAKNVKKVDKWAVFKAKLKGYKIFDLWENEDHKKEFRELKNELYKKHVEFNKNPRFFKEVTVFIYIAQKKKDLQMLRVPVDGNSFGHYSYVVYRLQVQICVKDLACIENNRLIKVESKG